MIKSINLLRIIYISNHILEPNIFKILRCGYFAIFITKIALDKSNIDLFYDIYLLKFDKTDNIYSLKYFYCIIGYYKYINHLFGGDKNANFSG